MIIIMLQSQTWFEKSLFSFHQCASIPNGNPVTMHVKCPRSQFKRIINGFPNGNFQTWILLKMMWKEHFLLMTKSFSKGADVYARYCNIIKLVVVSNFLELGYEADKRKYTNWLKLKSAKIVCHKLQHDIWMERACMLAYQHTVK